MSSSEKPGSPYPVQRTDAGSRKIIEHLDTFAQQVNIRLDGLDEKVDQALRGVSDGKRRAAALEMRIKKRPTWGKVLLTIGGSVAGVIALVWNVTWLVSTRTADTSATASEKAVKLQLESFEQRIELRIQKSDTLHQTEHRALYDAAPRRRRSPLLEQPVANPDGGTEDSP